MERKKLLVIGGGLRGKAYSKIAFENSEKFEIVALAEPIKERRLFLQKSLNLPDSMVFESFEPLLAMPKIADAAIIATMDRDHFVPAMSAIEKGYHLLLEKPISPLPHECFAIEEAAKKKGVHVLVCHVLRYTPFFRAIKNMIDEGMLGRIISIQLEEPVGNVHQSHSFVRGNWANSDESSSMILQKSCHDMDILQWLIGKNCLRVQSFGSLSYFKRDNAPDGSPEYCIDGCPHADECEYNAVKLYLDDKNNDWFRTSSSKSYTPTDEDVERALRNTEYGKCVFKCRNNVVDHQVVNLEFEDEITCTFSMCAFSRGARRIRIMGTGGEIVGTMGQPTLSYTNFKSKRSEEIHIANKVVDDTIVGGHGGGDNGIIHAFYDLLCGKENISLSDVSVSVNNHIIAFAAERSRVEGRVVETSEYNR